MCLFWQTRPFSRICAFFLLMKDALFIVPHDIYIGRALYEVRLGALRYEEKNSVEPPKQFAMFFNPNREFEPVQILFVC